MGFSLSVRAINIFRIAIFQYRYRLLRAWAGYRVYFCRLICVGLSLSCMLACGNWCRFVFCMVVVFLNPLMRRAFNWFYRGRI